MAVATGHRPQAHVRQHSGIKLQASVRPQRLGQYDTPRGAPGAEGDGMGLLKKSVPVNAREKQLFNIVESEGDCPRNMQKYLREVILTDGKIMKTFKPSGRYSTPDSNR